MRRTSAQARILKFATYEVDRDSGELYKSGVRQKLTGQHFEVLCLLLEHPHEVVTREQFQEHIWSRDTFVDYDVALRKAITHLRELLGDSAENPHYIETIPRKGYRFIAAVESKGQVDAGKITSTAYEQVAHSENSADVVPPSVVTPEKRNKRATWVLGVAVAIPLIGSILWFIRNAPLPRVRDWVQITNNGLAKGNVLTDGTRLYFDQVAGTGLLTLLAQVSTQGGEVAPISLPFDNDMVVLWDISPNKSELLLGVFGTPTAPDAELWVLPIAAGSPRRVADLVGHDACWAPNGKNIAYANSTDLYLANANGTQARKLATTTGIQYGCRFSPDGARIRFTVMSNNGPAALWEVTTAGTDLHRLREGICCGSWSADGKYYFFNNGEDIWVARGDDSNLDDRSIARLTSGPLQAGDPVPSVDGKALFVLGMQLRGELSRFDVRSKTVATFLNGISAMEVNISPDRKWAAYVSFPDLSLWRSKVDGTERLQLTSSPTQASEPQWSPDGKEILFTDMPRQKIFMIGSGGGSLRELMPNEKAEITGSGTWSPDARSIVFVRGSPGETAIYRLDLQSGYISSVPGSERMYSARLSPTGRYISAIRYSQDSLMLYDLKLGTWSELAHGGNFDCNSWSQDGKFVHVNNRLPSEPLIIERVRIADHKRERIATLKDMSWVSFDGEDSIIFTREASTYEIYRVNLNVPRF
jgi:Tol biopolymer transport system component/DNA-binding winged helix-turn-helix (wHTH) protein